MKMVLAVQVSIDARLPETVIALLGIVSVDANSSGVKWLPHWKWKLCQVVVLEKALQPIDRLVQARKHPF